MLTKEEIRTIKELVRNATNAQQLELLAEAIREEGRNTYACSHLGTNSQALTSARAAEAWNKLDPPQRKRA